MEIMTAIIPKSFKLLNFLSCTIDGFLFNTEKIDNYQLPENTIDESLIEQITFTSEGKTLYGYWIGLDGGNSDVTVLYCHGNKYNIDEYWDRVMYLHQLGVNVFIFDYRGYGKSEGEPSEKGLYADGEAALNYVLSRDEVRADLLCLYGYSLGNVVSIYLAAKSFTPLCLIAEAPFASIYSLMQASVGSDLPSKWLANGEYDNITAIAVIGTPFLLVHGEEDDLVRYRDNGKLVFEKAPFPKSLILVPKAKHNDIPKIMEIENYLNTIWDWIVFSKEYTNH